MAGNLGDKLPQLFQPKYVGLTAALLLLGFTLMFFHRGVFEGRMLSPIDAACVVDVVWNEACGDINVAHNGLISSDQAAQFYPWRVLVRTFIRQGIMPLWNPYAFSGYPLLANGQSAIFYPINLLANFLPLRYAFTFRAVMLLFVAAFSTFLLARQLGISGWGALFAAISFGFCSPLVVWLGYALVEVASLFPLLLFFTEKLFKKATWAGALALGLVLGLMGIAGHPETLASCMVVWAAYLALRLAIYYQAERPAIGQPVALIVKIGVASLLSLGLAAVQILPIWRIMWGSNGFSDRTLPVPPQLFQAGTNPGDVLSLLMAIWPSFFGNPSWVRLGGGEWFNYIDFNALSVYAGFLPLVLAPWALAHARKNRVVWLYGVIVLVSLALLLKLPVFYALSRISFLEKMEVVRFRIFVALGVAVLGGFGLDAFVAQRRRWYAALVVLATAALFVGLGYPSLKLIHSSLRLPTTEYSLAGVWQLANAAAFPPEHWVIPAVAATLLPLLLALALLAAVWLPARKLGGVLVLLLALDMFITNADFNTTVSPDLEATKLAPKSQTISYLQAHLTATDRLAAAGVVLLPNSSTLLGISDARGYDLMVSQRYYGLFAASSGYHRYGPGGFFVTEPNPILRLVGVNYLLSLVPVPGLEPVFTAASGVKIYHLADALPRAYAVTAVQALSAEAVRAAVLANSFNPATTALIESAPPTDWTPPTAAVNATVKITDYQPNTVTISTQSDQPFFLVLADGYDAGWRVLVDGQPRPLYQTNYVLRGVFMPAGAHTVRFEYDPIEFKVGALLTVTTLLGMAIAAVALRIKKKQADR